VKQFALGLRADLLGANIRVTNIEPGMTETDIMLVRFRSDPERKAKVYEGMTPIDARRCRRNDLLELHAAAPPQHQPYADAAGDAGVRTDCGEAEMSAKSVLAAILRDACFAGSSG